METYTLPANLVQGIVNALSDMPAGRSRTLLNAIESETVAQDKERADKADADKRAAIVAEVQAELAANPKEATAPAAPPAPPAAAS